jgi:hydroxyacylglutathione hydrolase
MRIEPIACLSDNYAYVVVCEATGEAAIVDPSEAEPVAAVLEKNKQRPKAIWSTHHHWDHVGGNEELARRYGAEVFGHASDRGRLPAQTRFLESGERFSLGRLAVEVHHIPGHTLGAIAYVVRDTDGAGAVFTGDTMFVAGCGRLFEGAPAQMHASLSWLAALDPAVKVYCGHEYTVQNLRFARSLEPKSEALASAEERAKEARAAGKATVPSTIGEERRTNPFLRAASAEIRGALGVPSDADDVTAFAAIRTAKDGFR